MPNYAEIADRAVEIIGSADPAQYQTAFDVMVAETVSITKDIDTADIKKYLILADKWLPIKISTEVAAHITMDALSVFESFRLTDPVTGQMVSAKLESMMDALITAGLLNIDDKTEIMSMGNKSQPKWSGLKPGHVQNALEYRAGGSV
jgi:hypothetical protein